MNVKKFVVVMKKYSRKLLYVYSSEHSQREGISMNLATENQQAQIIYAIEIK